MRLLGRDIEAGELLERIGKKLVNKGVPLPPSEEAATHIVDEPRLDPVAYNVESLEKHVDARRSLPFEASRKGFREGCRWAFRKSCQLLIDETLARQTVFNRHVYQAYAELSAEVLRLRDELQRVQKSSPNQD